MKPIHRRWFVNSELPVNSVQELIAYAKANPGKLSYGSSGIGSVFHLTGRAVQPDEPKSTSRTFPIAAWPKPMQDVAAGHIQMMHISLASAQGALHSGKANSARHPRAAALLEAAGRPVDDGNPPRLSQAFDLVRILRPRQPAA